MSDATQLIYHARMSRVSLSLVLLVSTALHAAEPESLVLDFPIYDAPYNNSDGYTAPSMRQSLAITKDFYQFTHNAIAQRFPERRQARLWATIGLDFLMTWLPPGDSWLHEEWHRAVMGQYGIDSYNDVYNLPLFADTIAVSHVRDEDLVWLKTHHPADQVRLSAAGLEAQNELVTAMERDAFFFDVRNFNLFLYWSNLANNTFYLATCASRDADSITSDAYESEGRSISKRDFTGLDCNAWVYDLFRPNEPYEARGTHPSGVGIDRYIDWSDLSQAERDFLRRQRNLSLLSFVDPFLFGFDDGFRWGNTRVSANLRHYLTSFGYTLDAHVFLAGQSLKTNITAHWYRNKNHGYPGISVEWMNLPLPSSFTRVRVSLLTALWRQPDDQVFDTRKATTGGELAARVDIAFAPPWGFFVEVDGKTEGWVSGSVYLDRNVSGRFGVQARWARPH